MPRQSRRVRTQSTGRKRTTPIIPRHLLEGARPATLEPPATEVSEDMVVEELETAPAMAASPRIDRNPAPAPRPEPRSGFVRAGSVAAKESTPVSARLAATDYGYVIGELKRIFITAAIIVILLVVIAVLRH